MGKKVFEKEFSLRFADFQVFSQIFYFFLVGPEPPSNTYASHIMLLFYCTAMICIKFLVSLVFQREKFNSVSFSYKLFGSAFCFPKSRSRIQAANNPGIRQITFVTGRAAGLPGGPCPGDRGLEPGRLHRLPRVHCHHPQAAHQGQTARRSCRFLRTSLNSL